MSPSNRLAEAERDWQLAYERCPHWEFLEFDVDSMHECCFRLDEARLALRRARWMVKRQTAGVAT